jgi:hypothetical protein
VARAAEVKYCNMVFSEVERWCIKIPSTQL